jgi:uncharacterized metal-binding protein YceD (DUF177 family)
MTIEFRKVPLNESEFEIVSDSVKFSGTFSKISQKIVKVRGHIFGETIVECCKCGKEITLKLDEKTDLLISDGIYSSSEDEDEIVVEVENHMIDFDAVLASELESLKSEYYICDECKDSENLIEIEY